MARPTGENGAGGGTGHDEGGGASSARAPDGSGLVAPQGAGTRASEHRQRHRPAPMRPLSPLVWLVSTALGAVVAVLAPTGSELAVRIVLGWDVAAVVQLAVAWQVIFTTGPDRTRHRAGLTDPGRVALFGIAVVACVAAVGAAIYLLGSPGEPPSSVAIGVAAITFAWFLLHTSFALHYAHEYYRDDAAPGGLRFDGGPPADIDFAYFALTIGMTFQTADVAIARRGLRKLVLAQALLSFLFNTVILALAINLLFGHLR